MTIDEAYRITELMDVFGDLPDGAFFAALAEHGIDAEDIQEAHEILEAQS